MIWNWLRRKLWLRTFEDAVDEITKLEARIAYLERWVGGIDSALWRVDQQTQAPPDLKVLASRIKSQMMAAKTAFPTNTGGAR